MNQGKSNQKHHQQQQQQQQFIFDNLVLICIYRNSHSAYARSLSRIKVDGLESTGFSEATVHEELQKLITRQLPIQSKKNITMEPAQY